MELKLVNFNRRNDNNRSLNCTVMELKQTVRGMHGANFECLNCTVMELKRAFMQVAKVEDRVLIVPLWN